MSSNLVKAVIDTGKPDTIEFQVLPGHLIQEHDVITYDKMNGIQFQVSSISSDDWITCTILGKGMDVYHLQLKYFQPMTMLFVLVRITGDFKHISHSGEIGIVEFS